MVEFVVDEIIRVTSVAWRGRGIHPLRLCNMCPDKLLVIACMHSIHVCTNAFAGGSLAFGVWPWTCEVVQFCVSFEWNVAADIRAHVTVANNHIPLIDLTAAYRVFDRFFVRCRRLVIFGLTGVGGVSTVSAQEG